MFYVKLYVLKLIETILTVVIFGLQQILNSNFNKYTTLYLDNKRFEDVYKNIDWDYTITVNRLEWNFEKCLVKNYKPCKQVLKYYTKNCYSFYTS